MFTPRGATTRSRASPFTPTPQSTRQQSKRMSNIGYTPKGRTSMYGHKSQGNRSLQTSQILEEAGGHRVESYGLPLPVLITEALSLADRHTEITVRIDPSGWSWLVGGRKLFIWRHIQSHTARGVFCKELTLPPSDLAHNADRVCVVPSITDAQSASCVAVSPEGIVRYWANVAYEGSSSEISAELRGEECACVINFQPYGCLLATTTSSLVLLAHIPGQTGPVCYPLTASQGMFAGIGRRMSSFIFGASPMQPSGATLQAIVPGCEEEEERPFFVLTGTQLQKWTVSEGNTEKLFYQIDVDRMFREALARKVWDQDSLHLTQLKTWLIDMQTTRSGVLILGVGVNMEASLTMHFVLATIDTDINGTPAGFEDLLILDHKENYTEEMELKLQNLKLLVPDPSSGVSYVYDDERVLLKSGESSEVTEFHSPGGMIIGAGNSDGAGVFFSSSVGMFCFSSNNKQNVSLLADTTMDYPSISNADMSALAASSSQIHELSLSKDKTSRLKSAFLSAMRGDMDLAQAGVDELFPLSDNTNTDMNEVVVAVSLDLIDDYPASDPRWAESRQDPCSSTTSLIILNQLSDKLRAHDYIISFLKKVGLWKRLSTVTSRDHQMLTHDVLCEHAEKVTAAMALRQLHSEYTGVIDAAIKKVLEKRDANSTTQGLSPQDVFYREVSKTHEILTALLEYEEEVLAADVTTPEILAVVAGVNAVMEAMLHKALQHRHAKISVYREDLEPSAFVQLEFLPWTSQEGDKGTRNILLRQYAVTLDSTMPEVTDTDTMSLFCQQLAQLADIILEGFSTQLESLLQQPDRMGHYRELDRKYQLCRQQLITPLMEKDHMELAASLAEKYYDFDILIQLCEQIDNADRIERYLTQFSDKGFADILYAWYMKEGKLGKLLSLPAHRHQELGQFLQSKDIKYLSWLHQLQTNNYTQAHESLLELSRMETNSLSKKKTLLSLSKLAGLASDDNEEDINITGINEELDLITHQEQLPAHVLHERGLDPEDMAVLSPEQLIELYVSDMGVEDQELNFKKALDLLQYIDRTDPNIDVEALRYQIWAKAILRNSWAVDQSGEPLETIKDTIFFKVATLAYNEGIDLSEYLPQIELLLRCEDLGLLQDDRNFQYLLRVGYEHIQQTLY
ncbi:nuclear pore complex protein Nup133-like [Argopecten irradians]|uniref:nuclear pore complex protein Nup133-like n=1 Tax=Argopecten irradians TaxID=31199 RepID=UPI00371C33FF